MTWDSWSGGGIANLPGYKVGDEGVCGVKGKRASISSYGCIADPETRGKENCPDKIQETAEVSTKLTFYRVVHMYLDDFTRLFRGHWVT